MAESMSCQAGPRPSEAPPKLHSVPGSRTNSQSRQSKQSTPPSPRAHDAYLNSLPVPTPGEFSRLLASQQERVNERKRRDCDLRARHRVAARRSMEARRHFMHAKTAAATRDSNPSAIQSRAALVIQRSFRGYRVRREMRGLDLDASTRWTHAIRDARWQDINKPRARDDKIASASGSSAPSSPEGKQSSIARQNWGKAAAIAKRAGADEDSLHSSHSLSSSCDEPDLSAMSPKDRSAALERREKAERRTRKHTKMMGLQYFLEMVDLKHRYGSNLRTYHEEWKRSDTKENFFYWLDYGQGKEIDLQTCPRARLDREQVRYLSREERRNYLVEVDREGRLVWAKNGVRVDTTEAWRDSIHGIVPQDDPSPAFSPDVEKHVQSKPTAKAPPELHHHGSHNSASTSNTSHPSESELEQAVAAKYANPGLDEAKGVKKLRRVSAATIFNRLMRKSVRKNTWIFVADTAFRLYIGIKNSGSFQHSSFLHGARISSAGLIKVKEGRISSLSPLSGHYRPPAANFRAFVHSLEDREADMSHVSISKSYAVLVGLEAYVKTRKKGKETVQRITHRGLKVVRPEEAAEKEEAEKDTSRSAAREREVLEREREQRELQRIEARPSTQLKKKLGIGTSGAPGLGTDDRTTEKQETPNDQV